MPATNRQLILAATLAVGVAAQVVGVGPPAATPRWPASPAVFEVAGWSTGDPGMDSRAGTVFVNRRYMSTDGRVGAVLGLVTSTDAKRVYRAGADVPFAGSGYSISTATEGLALGSSDRSVFLASRAGGSVLVFATHGERRGLVGNGLAGWAFAIFDGLLGRSNDYFEATLVVSLDSESDATARRAGAVLADRVFAQIAEWYAR